MSGKAGDGKMTDFKKQGRKNRLNGAKFEREVRAELERQGWIVDKWANNVELEIVDKLNNVVDDLSCSLSELGGGIGVTRNKLKGRLNPAKSNRFNMRTCGFPDFICLKPTDFEIKKSEEFGEMDKMVFKVIGVEAKSNGYLDKEEKEKCRWLLNNNIFSKILIASKNTSGTSKIKFIEFEK